MVLDRAWRDCTVVTFEIPFNESTRVSSFCILILIEAPLLRFKAPLSRTTRSVVCRAPVALLL